MRKLIIALAGLAAAIVPAASASAQGRYGGGYGYNNHGGYDRGASRDCRRALRHADNRWEYRRALRDCRRDRYRDDRGWRDDRHDRRGGYDRRDYRRGW